MFEFVFFCRERALLAITLNNELDEVLAHAAFLDYPNIETIDSATWFEWFCAYYKAGFCTPLNTLFLHYFVSKLDYVKGCARELIRTMFNAIPDVHYCLLAVPLGIELGKLYSSAMVLDILCYNFLTFFLPLYSMLTCLNGCISSVVICINMGKSL